MAIEVVRPDPALLFDEVEAGSPGDRRAVLSAKDPLVLLGRHDGDDPEAPLSFGLFEVGSDVVELAVVPAGAVRLLQVQERDVVFVGEHLHRAANRVPIRCITAGQGMGSPRCPVMNVTTWPGTCRVGT